MLAVVLSGGGGVADPLAWDGLSFRKHVEPGARVAFPVPLTQALVEARHFPEATAAQASHAVTISGRDRVLVELAVFNNPKRLGLDAFVAAILQSSSTALRLDQAYSLSATLGGDPWSNVERCCPSCSPASSRAPERPRPMEAWTRGAAWRAGRARARWAPPCAA